MIEFGSVSDDDESRVEENCGITPGSVTDGDADQMLTSVQQTMENSRLSALQKDLAKEMKVKDGLEKFMSTNTSASRRYLEDSKNMLDDSKAKIALLRMQIDKIAHQEYDQQTGNGAAESKSHQEVMIDDLLFRLRKETALIDGAKNMVKILRAQPQKKSDHRSLNDASL
uniref:Hr1 domain-containing protein n=1 Tax=Heterorhabditis bacteriophora TaxID=37862 RepID=A0A1I7X410_HETBA